MCLGDRYATFCCLWGLGVRAIERDFQWIEQILWLGQCYLCEWMGGFIATAFAWRLAFPESEGGWCKGRAKAYAYGTR